MEGTIKNYQSLITFALLALLVVPQGAVAANSVWTDIPAAATNSGSQLAPRQSTVSRFISVRRLNADDVLLRQILEQAPVERGGVSATTAAKAKRQAIQIQLPMPDGGFTDFSVVESPVMAPELAAKYPQIKTYKVRSTEGPQITGRLSIGPSGFHAYISSPNGTVYVDPEPTAAGTYNSFYKKNYISSARSNFTCGVKSEGAESSPVEEFKTLARSSDELRTYRIAVATTGEYSQGVGNGDPVDTLNEVVSAINRVNVIYERDLAISLMLVANNDLIIYTNGAADPYTDGNGPVLLTENQTNLTAVIGTANYDIGHIFSTDAGGVASVGVVCDDNGKARGETGIGVFVDINGVLDTVSATSDPFHIDFVAHEIGHQFSARHSFNGTDGSCGGNRNAPTAYEPGSGSTIMAYADLCVAEDVQSFADAIFHAGSVAQILSFAVGGGSCVAPTATGNTAPTVNAGSDYTIPARTPFSLTGSATDPELDVMTYQWDQMDVGSATNATTYGTDLGDNPLFRSFPPLPSETRDFPQLVTLLGGIPDQAETLPTENRSLNFRLTARDGNGGVDEDDMRVNVVEFSGPFAVTQPNTAVTLDTMQTQVIEWETACTDQVPVSCANVDILLDTEDAGTFATTLLANTPNDGAQSINFSAVLPATTAVIKVACSDNIFFDISANIVLEQNSGIALNATGAVSNVDCGPGVELLGAIDGDGSSSPVWLTLMTGWLLYFRRQQKMNAARSNSKGA